MNFAQISRNARSVLTLNRALEYRTLCRMLAIRPENTLLDIGSGDGYWTARLGTLCHRVIGLEPDPTLMGYAEAFNHHPNVTYVEGIAENIPYPDASFDKVISISCFEHFADQEKSLVEIRRVLKPGGVVAMSVDSLLPENSSLDFREWHSHKHFVTRYFAEAELAEMLRRHGLAYDAPGTIRLFRSRVAARLREKFIRHPKVWLLLFPVFYAGVRLSDALWDEMPGQILIIRAVG